MFAANTGKQSEYGVVYCGPGTVWDDFSKVCLPDATSGSSAKVDAACPNGYEKGANGLCMQKNAQERICKPFKEGVSYEGENIGHIEKVLNPNECAVRCLREFNTDYFTYNIDGNTRSCVCRNSAKAVPDPEQPHCELNTSAPHKGINVHCGTTIIKAAHYNLSTALDKAKAKAEDEANLKRCNAKAKSGDFMGCASHISGETCSLDVSQYCDLKSTELKDSKCVGKAPDMLKVCDSKTTTLMDGKCVGLPPPEIDLMNICDKTTQVAPNGKQCTAVPPPKPAPPPPVRLDLVADEQGFMLPGAECKVQSKYRKTTHAENEKGCADACEKDAKCVASTYDNQAKTCTINMKCPSLLATASKNTTLNLPKEEAPKVHTGHASCGTGTTFDAGSKMCVATPAERFCGTNAKYDKASHKCVGENTMSTQNCGAGTKYDAGKKQCVRDVTQGGVFCGTNTAFDGKTNKCVGQETQAGKDAIKQVESLQKQVKTLTDAKDAVQKKLDEKNDAESSQASEFMKLLQQRMLVTSPAPPATQSTTTNDGSEMRKKLADALSSFMVGAK